MDGHIVSGQDTKNAKVDQPATYTLLVTNSSTGCTATAEVSVQQDPCCMKSTGIVDTLSLLVCGNQTAHIIHDGGQVLSPNDTLCFILFTDTLHALASIVAFGDTLAFPFLPGVMYFDSTYYVAAIVGQLLPNDSIDLSDPCLAFSPGPTVVWRRIPTIGLVPSPLAVCGKDCLELDFQLSGTLPFQFTWQAWQNGILLKSVMELTLSSPKTVVVCPGDFQPPAEPGGLDFRVLGLADKYCTCSAN